MYHIFSSKSIELKKVKKHTFTYKKSLLTKEQTIDNIEKIFYEVLHILKTTSFDMPKHSADKP